MKPLAWKTCIEPYLTEGIRKMLSKVDDALPVEELRIRAGQPIQLCFAGGERVLRRDGGTAAVTAADCGAILQRICAQSLYAWEEELKRGFITLPGGCRVGLCGGMTAAGGGFLSGDVSGFNFRIARAIPGAADAALPHISIAGRLLPSLIVSPPGYGKTTVLRDIARQASLGLSGLLACRVCVVDTRFELAGCVSGAPQLDLGPRTDVLSGVPKAEGMRMMITNMAPDVLITDELSTAQDAAAAMDARSCGVTLMASAHAESMTMLLARPAMRLLYREKIFSRYVVLARERGRLEAVYDEEGRLMDRTRRTCSAS